MPTKPLLLPLLALSLFLGSCKTTTDKLVLEISQGESSVRRYTIAELGEFLSGREQAGFPFTRGELQAIELLRDITKSDTEEVVNRMKAITALNRLNKVDNTSLFLEGLSSRYWGIRWECAKGLAAHPSPGAVGPLVDRLKTEKERVVLLDIVKALALAGGEDALDALFQVYFDESSRHFDNRMKAHAAICRLTGREFGLENANEWLKYYRERFPAKTAGPAGGKE